MISPSKSIDFSKTRLKRCSSPAVGTPSTPGQELMSTRGLAPLVTFAYAKPDRIVSAVDVPQHSRQVDNIPALPVEKMLDCCRDLNKAMCVFLSYRLDVSAGKCLIHIRVFPYLNGIFRHWEWDSMCKAYISPKPPLPGSFPILSTGQSIPRRASTQYTPCTTCPSLVTAIVSPYNGESQEELIEKVAERKSR